MKPTLEPLKAMCATCPFRPGSPYAGLANDLALSAMTEATRICHSTGRNAINGRTGKKPKACRGARDIQLKLFTSFGILKEPTDAAWAEAWAALKKARGIR